MYKYKKYKPAELLAIQSRHICNRDLINTRRGLIDVAKIIYATEGETSWRLFVGWLATLPVLVLAIIFDTKDHSAIGLTWATMFMAVPLFSILHNNYGRHRLMEKCRCPHCGRKVRDIQIMICARYGRCRKCIKSAQQSGALESKP